jgi:O-antigen/teichoic acid export membrane protein
MTPPESLQCRDERHTSGAGVSTALVDCPDPAVLEPTAHETASTTPKAPKAGGQRRHREPLFRNASALALNTAATSLLGAAFWILLGPRLYEPAVLGASFALISTIHLLSVVADLNLGSALTRFLPRAGASARRLVLSCYATAAALGIAVSLVALPFVFRSSAAGWFVKTGLPAVGWFIAAVVVWSVFSLQDGALVGLRQAIWVPVENAVFGVAKLVMLVVLAGAAPVIGIVASTTIPMMLALVPVNLLLFRRLLPQHETRSSVRAEPVIFGRIASFVAFDYLAALLVVAANDLLPVMVMSQLGAEANAYFSVAWLIASAFDFALVSVGTSLTAEGAHDPDRLAGLAAALGRRIMLVAFVGVMAIAIGAPYLLAVSGGAYSAEATTLLRLLALAILPKVAIVLWVSIAQVKRQVGRVLAVQGVLSVLVLAPLAPLLDHYGIDAVGIAKLAAQCVVAACLLPGLIRSISRRPANTTIASLS